MNRLLAALLCLAIGFGLGALKWRGTAESFHREARMAAILSQARQMPRGGIVVIGDSITERIRFDTLCGLPALNAGISWSTSKDWLPDAREVIAAAHPSIIVLEIGTNDRGRYPRERQELERLATFTVPSPSSTVDGVHPDQRGAGEFRAAIERRCHGTRP
jgi:dienelactone hydrolase